jgi:hypothetical protein
MLAAATLANADDGASVPPGETAVSPAAPTTARIVGIIPDGTPPLPAPPKPRLAIANEDILQTTTHKQGGRTITIREIKPIPLPPPPTPVVPQAGTELHKEFTAKLAEYRASHPRGELLFLGATVFRSKDFPPRTLVRWWPMGTGEEITFWSSADFALIAEGIQSFVDTAGDTHSLFMGWGNVDIDRMTDLLASTGREYDAPDMPEFAEGKATFKVTKGQPAAEDLVAIQSLHDIYNTEYSRLLTAWQGRERARIEREAYLKAHPPQPKDITLNYWRTEKPASKGKGEAAR